MSEYIIYLDHEMCCDLAVLESMVALINSDPEAHGNQKYRTRIAPHVCLND